MLPNKNCEIIHECFITCVCIIVAGLGIYRFTDIHIETRIHKDAFCAGIAQLRVWSALQPQIPPDNPLGHKTVSN